MISLSKEQALNFAKTIPLLLEALAGEKQRLKNATPPTPIKGSVDLAQRGMAYVLQSPNLRTTPYKWYDRFKRHKEGMWFKFNKEEAHVELLLNLLKNEFHKKDVYRQLTDRTCDIRFETKPFDVAKANEAVFVGEYDVRLNAKADIVRVCLYITSPNFINLKGDVRIPDADNTKNTKSIDSLNKTIKYLNDLFDSLNGDSPISNAVNEISISDKAYLAIKRAEALL